MYFFISVSGMGYKEQQIIRLIIKKSMQESLTFQLYSIKDLMDGSVPSVNLTSTLTANVFFSSNKIFEETYFTKVRLERNSLLNAEFKNKFLWFLKSTKNQTNRICLYSFFINLHSQKKILTC